jgi:hypothetical protein
MLYAYVLFQLGKMEEKAKNAVFHFPKRHLVLDTDLVQSGVIIFITSTCTTWYSYLLVLVCVAIYCIVHLPISLLASVESDVCRNPV